jgi:hypothetical protein
MRHRWLIYIAVGLVFGIADWYFLDLLPSLSQNPALNDRLAQVPAAVQLLFVVAIMAANFGIWLVPVVPAAIYKVKHSHSLPLAALTAVIVWVSALVSYYGWYTLMLMFAGLPNLDFMLYANRQSPTYWVDFWPPFRRVILNQFGEWLWVAVLGGAVVGILSALLYRRLSNKELNHA